MPGHPRLHRRVATYYHRAAIPKDIKATYPKTEEKSSLRTTDFEEAKRRVRIEAARVDRLFDDHRKMLQQAKAQALQELTDNQIADIREVYYRHLLEEDEETRLEGFYDDDEPLPDAPALSFEEYAELDATVDDANRQRRARGKVHAFHLDEAEEVLSWEGIDLKLAKDSPSWPKLARALQAASIEAADAKKRRNAGDVVDTPKAAPSINSGSAPKLSTVIREWLDEKSRSAWDKKTADAHRAWIDRFLELVGDRPIDTFKKADARKFKGVLVHLPANWTKFDALKGLSFEKASEKARKEGLAPMSDRNINKILGFVGSFWIWAEKQYDEAPGNLFRGLKVDISKSAREERDPFSISELERIFAAPLFTGCKSIRSYAQPGDTVPRTSGHFWVPLVALFSGMRLNEIIQLLVADICSENGIAYFDNNLVGPNKKLKNPAAKRKVPLHAALRDLGFMDFVEAQKEAGEERLFPDLPLGEDGYYSSPFSKRFGRFLKSAGVKKPKNAFHSFRHSFKDAGRNSGVPIAIIDAIQGHTEPGMAGRYGHGYNLETLAGAMNQICYDGLDLSHLSPKRS